MLGHPPCQTGHFDEQQGESTDTSCRGGGREWIGLKELESLFRLCPGQHVKNNDDLYALAYWAQSAFDFMAMGNYPYPSSYILNGDGQVLLGLFAHCLYKLESKERSQDDDKHIWYGICSLLVRVQYGFMHVHTY